MTVFVGDSDAAVNFIGTVCESQNSVFVPLKKLFIQIVVLLREDTFVIQFFFSQNSFFCLFLNVPSFKSSPSQSRFRENQIVFKRECFEEKKSIKQPKNVLLGETNKIKE